MTSITTHLHCAFMSCKIEELQCTNYTAFLEELREHKVDKIKFLKNWIRNWLTSFDDWRPVTHKKVVTQEEMFNAWLFEPKTVKHFSAWGIVLFLLAALSARRVFLASRISRDLSVKWRVRRKKWKTLDYRPNGCRSTTTIIIIIIIISRASDQSLELSLVLNHSSWMCICFISIKMKLALTELTWRF